MSEQFIAITHYLGILTALTFFGAIFLLLIVLVGKGPLYRLAERILGVFAGEWILLTSLVATMGSLYYSEIVLLPICPLCWYQRVCMYAQVVIFALAIWRKETSRLLPYALLLSSIGFLVGVYHYILQWTALHGASILPCPAKGTEASCEKVFFNEFGWVTLPLMAIVPFLWMMLIAVLGIRRSRLRGME